MDTLWEKIIEKVTEILIGLIQENLSDMFTAVNEQVSNANAQIGATPQSWNATIFGLVKTISDEAVIPIAGIIITYVLCYELISMIMEKNNLHDLDTWMFMKFVLKAAIAVYLVNYTFDITMAIFELGQTVVARAGDLGTATLITAGDMGLETMTIWQLLALVMETAIVKFIIQVLFVFIMLILYSRMIMIYLYASVSPIPFATLTNREWGNIGQNYIKGLLALAFQGFFMFLCVSIYAALVRDFAQAGGFEDVHKALWTSVGYGALLCFMLFKTDGISKSIFGAH